MKRRTKLSLLLVTCAVMIMGCGKEKTGGKSMEELSKQNLTPMSQIQFYDDYQSEQLTSYAKHGLAGIDEELYFAVQSPKELTSSIISGVDEEAGLMDMACKDKACGHKGEECVSYYQNFEEQVWSYKNNLYGIKQKYMDNAVLVNLGPDGSKRDEIVELGYVDKINRLFTSLAFCDDNVYSYMNNVDITRDFNGSDGTSLQMLKNSLDGKSSEVILYSDDKNGAFDNMAVYGGNVFFTYFTKEQSSPSAFDTIMTAKSKGLYCYDTRKGQFHKILDSDVSGYAIDMTESALYCYVAFEGLYRYDMKTGEGKMIYKPDDMEFNGICSVLFDGNNLYLDNLLAMYNYSVNWGNKEHKYGFTILDEVGKKLNEVRYTKGELLMMVDEEHAYSRSAAKYVNNDYSKFYSNGSFKVSDKEELLTTEYNNVQGWENTGVNYLWGN